MRLLVETLGHGWLVQLAATFDHTSLDALDIVKPEFANTLQEDLLATLKVIHLSHAQSNCLIFSLFLCGIQKSSPKSDSEIIVVDLTEAQPICKQVTAFFLTRVEILIFKSTQMSCFGLRKLMLENRLLFSYPSRHPVESPLTHYHFLRCPSIYPTRTSLLLYNIRILTYFPPP